MTKRWTLVCLAIALTGMVTGCGALQRQTERERGGQAETQNEVTLQVFTNLPDRCSGQGLAEQMLFDAYMEENPQVEIAVEALEDEAYKAKLRAYISGSQMPDLITVWGEPEFMDQLMEAGVLVELNPADYEGYGFTEHSLDGFSQGGRLYGLPRNRDIACFYYNAGMFEEYGWQVPETFEELLALAGRIRERGLIPVAMDGLDQWPLNIFFTDLMQQNCQGDLNAVLTEALAKKNFSDDIFSLGMDLLGQCTAAGLFQDKFETSDYSTAQHLFLDGKAAMFYMGSWDMDMARDPRIDAGMREEIRVFFMPPLKEQADGSRKLTMWHGGGYAVTRNGANREEALKLLSYMMRPEGWPWAVLENGACISAQEGEEPEQREGTSLQSDFLEALSLAESFSGVPLADRGDTSFRQACLASILELALGHITPEECRRALSFSY